jgi:gas vesicle protein
VIKISVNNEEIAMKKPPDKPVFDGVDKDAIEPIDINSRVLFGVLISDIKGVRTEFVKKTDELSANIKDVRDELSADIKGVRDELSANIKDVRNELSADIKGVRNELSADIKGVRNEMYRVTDRLSADIQDVRTELKEFRSFFRNCGIAFIVGFLGIIGTMIGMFLKIALLLK